METALVAIDFKGGMELLQALDRSDLSINVAMWLFSPEHEDWRFVLASRRLDAAEPSEAYGLVHDALAGARISLERTPALLILKMSDPSYVRYAGCSPRQRVWKECGWVGRKSGICLCRTPWYSGFVRAPVVSGVDQGLPEVRGV